MQQTSSLTGGFLPLLEIKDRADYLTVFPSGINPLAVDAYEVKIPFRLWDYQGLAMITRPFDFEYRFNGQLATISVGGLNNTLITANAVDSISTRRTRTIYPAAELISENNPPFLVVNFIKLPLAPPQIPFPVHVEIYDTNWQLMWLDFTLLLMPGNVKMQVANNNSWLLAPYFLDGDFFEVINP